MSLVSHARNEFKALGWDKVSDDDGMQQMMCEDIIELLEAFANQGHSGFRVNYLLNIFEKLARYEPLGPLTGEDWEWNDVGGYAGYPMWQNKRCSAVFKDADGKAYWIDGKIFVEPDGSSYTNSNSRVYISFPWKMPKPEIVHVWGGIDEPISEDQDHYIALNFC